MSKLTGEKIILVHTNGNRKGHEKVGIILENTVLIACYVKNALKYDEM